MAEPGKSGLLAYLLSYVAECVRLRQQPGWCGQVHALAWAATVQRLPLSLALPVTGEPPALSPAGRADLNALMDALERELADAEGPVRVLLMSDGGIDQAAQKRWQTWRSRFPIDIRAVAVGADASRAALEGLAGKDALFGAEAIGMALHDWTVPHAAPRSLAETVAVCVPDTVADDWQ
jgi:hypothetical protein